MDKAVNANVTQMQEESDGYTTAGEAYSTTLDTALNVETGSIYIDTACGCPVTNNKAVFTAYSSCSRIRFKTANGTYSRAIGKGIIELRCLINGVLKNIRIKDVYFVPDFGKTLISIDTLWTNGYDVSLDKTSRTCSIFNEEKDLVGLAKTLDGILTLQTYVYSEITAASAQTVSSTSMLWHKRCGHLHHAALKRLASENLMEGITLKDVEEPFFCDACQHAKQTRLPFQTSTRVTTVPGELIHMDICGPFEV